MSRRTFSHDLEIKQGEDFREAWVFAIDGVPVDLTGATGQMQLRRSGASSSALLASAVVTLGTSDGGVSYFIADTITVGLEGQGLYDLLVTYSNGDKQYLLEGSFKIIPRITQ